MGRPIDLLRARLTRLPNHGFRGLKFVCPLADDGDRDHVLRVDVRPDGQTLNVFCHNLCSTADVLAAINLRLSDLFPVQSSARSRQGPKQSDEVRLRRSGLSDEEIQKVLARAR